MKNNIYEEDIYNIIKKCDVLNSLYNSTVLITGSTGLIGKTIVLTLLKLNEFNNANITIISTGRNVAKARKIFGNYLNNRLVFIESDIINLINIDHKIDYIIHCASVTKSKEFVDKPVDTINTMLTGTRNMLEIAKIKNVKSMVYLSSLEVYGTYNNELVCVDEKNYGYIDFNNIRSSYSEGKRMAECMCCAYASQYNIDVKIARLTQILGAGIDYSDTKVFTEFMKNIIEGKEIVLKTKGETTRTYCYLTDAITGILYILLNGKQGEAYNIANGDAMISIKELAEYLVKKYNGMGLKFDIEENLLKLGYNPTVKIRLDTKKLQALGWTADISLEEMCFRTMSWLKLCYNRNN